MRVQGVLRVNPCWFYCLFSASFFLRGGGMLSPERVLGFGGWVRAAVGVASSEAPF